MKEKVNIPFRQDSEALILAGRKTMTTRPKRYGYEADYFEISGRIFILIQVLRVALGTVAYHWFESEGYDSPEEFIDIWNKLHPRKRFQANWPVYAHSFKAQAELATFHLHDVRLQGSLGWCEQCQFPFQEEGETASLLIEDTI